MKKTFICFAALLYLAFCLSCAAPKIVPKPITLPPRAEQRIQPPGEKPAEAVERKERPGVEIIAGPTFDKVADKPAVEKTPAQRERKEPLDPRRVNLAPGPISINAEKMPLSDFVIYALGETLKVPFVLDEKTMNDKQPVTLRMPQPMSADKSFLTIVELLEKAGFYLEEKGGTLYILSRPPQPPPPSPWSVRLGRSVVESQAEILQVVPLRHTTPFEMQQLLPEISRTKITIKPYLKGNVLLLYGRADEISRAMEIIEAFDVPYFEDKKMHLLRFTYMRAEDFVTEIRAILTGLGFRIGTPPLDLGPQLIPIRQLNGVLLISPDEKTTRLIIDWKEKLDSADSAGAEERAYTYAPRFSKATDLVKSIQTLYGGAPLADAASAQRAGAQKPPSPAGALQPGLKISADENKNIILIVATPGAYKIIHRLLADLDTPPKQALVEVTIVEVTLTGDLKYGVEWYIRDTQQGGQYTLGTLGRLGLTSMGLSYSFVSQTGNLQALVSALASENRATILSTPRLMVLDNKEAVIQVGSDIPTVTGEMTPTTTSAQPGSIMRSISYRSTGIVLKVKPIINAEGILTLEIAQEVSQPGAPGVGDSPVILTRRINTTVSVGHGQTIALGGLFKDNEGESETKVPLLGDIPLLGHLFKYTAKTKEKTELLVLVTPTIVLSSDEASTITNELKKELKWFKFPETGRP